MTPKCAGFAASQFIDAQKGIAVLIALIALCLLSLLGLYMTLNASGDLRISDNHESHIRAKYAALAGLNHARALLRGLDFNDLLSGPDGVHDSSPSYVAFARTFAFRNPVSWATARSLNTDDPAGDLSGLPDDGIISTGYAGGTPGVVLIPLVGVAQSVPNPYGSGTIITSRYLVKVSDNSGEDTELAGDPADDPFFDGDGTIVVRSMGIARTISEQAGTSARQNSVVVFEARYRHRSTFDLISPLVIEGSQIEATFTGSDFTISGETGPGIGAIDTNTADAIHPDQILILATGGRGTITGGGLPNPSIQDITARLSLDSERTDLLDPNYLWDFVTNRVVQAADVVYKGDQTWSTGTTPYIGAFDVTKPINDSGQDPKITLVDGNLSVSGSVTGGGLLVIRGDFLCSPSFSYSGLILVIGTGKVDASGFDPGVVGGMLVANLTTGGGVPAFGIPSLSITGKCVIAANAKAVRMAIGLLPPSQISFREVTSTMDP